MGMKPTLSAMGSPSKPLGYHRASWRQAGCAPKDRGVGDLDRQRGGALSFAPSWRVGVGEDRYRGDQRRSSMKRLGIVAALLGLLFAIPSPALAQVKGVYWATSGFFGPFPITDLIPSVPKEKARNVTIPISMWVIDHPKGLVVFDTGNNAAI